MRARMVTVVTLGALLLGLSACGQAPQQSPSYQPATSSPSVAPPPTSALKTEFGAAAAYKFTARDGRGDGYTEEVELLLGAPIPASQAPQPLPASCPLNPQRDLYIPLSIKVTNTTKNFPSYKVNYRFKPVTLDNDRLVGYVNAGEGKCVERFGLVPYEGPTLGLSSKAELPVGQFVQTTGFIAFRDFFSPNGNRAEELAKVFLALGIRYDGKHGIIVDPKAGPGQIGYTGLDGLGVSDYYVIPLNGVTSPCTKGMFKREAHC